MNGARWTGDANGDVSGWLVAWRWAAPAALVFTLTLTQGRLAVVCPAAAARRVGGAGSLLSIRDMPSSRGERGTIGTKDPVQCNRARGGRPPGMADLRRRIRSESRAHFPAGVCYAHSGGRAVTA